MNNDNVPPIESGRMFIGVCAILDSHCIGNGKCENCKVFRINEEKNETMGGRS